MSSRRKRAKQEPKRHIIPFALILIVGVLVGVVGFSTAGAFALVQSWLIDVPSIDDASAFSDPRKTRVYASDGTTLLADFYEFDREPVSAGQVSPNLFNATVAIEDERFWGHRGVDYYGIARAAVNDLMGGDLQGASTITQQFVRQTLLQKEATESTIRRKVREAYLALELEKRFTKEDVLMMYLNTINYGDGSWGVQSAAQHYFSKNASELTVPEAALLSGIPQNPTYNNPVEFPDTALKRRNMVLDRMYVNGYITEGELEEYKATELNLNVRVRVVNGIYQQPYFTSYLRQELFRMEEEGTLAPGATLKGGLTVYATIDLQMQAYADDACATKEANLPSNAEVSLLNLDPNNGYIKAMRGGKDFYTDQVNTTTQMARPAGSTFKVFALVTALEGGYSPQTTVSGASPFVLPASENGGRPWEVKNYGGQNMGTMSLANATWVSSNTAYARVVRKLSPAPVVETAHRMGITSDISPYPSVVLGAVGVNTLEMASAFGTLATGGVYHKPTAITKIVDYQGNVIYDHANEVEGERKLTPEIAYAANQVLKGVVTGGTGTSANLGWQVSAGKTGTADEYTDSWFVGYTPQLSTAIWIGDRSGLVYIPDNVGGANCCPVWKQFMSQALVGYEAQDFPVASSPTYNPKATFLTAEEQKEEEEKKKKEEEEKKKKEEEEAAAAKKKAEDEAKKKAEEEAAAQQPPTNEGTDPNAGGTNGGAVGGDPNAGGGGGDSGGAGGG